MSRRKSDASNGDQLNGDNGTAVEAVPQPAAAAPASAAEQLAQFENKVFGKRAPRVQGKVERGHGSLLRGLSPEDQALHAALEEQAEAEAALAGAHVTVAATQAALDAATERCAKAAEVSEKAAADAVAAQAEG